MARKTTQTRVLAVERQRRIMEMLSLKTALRISEVCHELGVSAVTVRSDFDALERLGKLKRTRGGAVPISELVVSHVPERMKKNAHAKRAIAQAAAKLVHDGETILVGSGSTTLEFVHALGEKRDITIISNACQVIEYAEQHLPDTTIVSTGGELGRNYRHYFGPMVAASLANVFVDKVFLGADGFEPSFGFLAEYERTASTKVEFMKHARTKIILIDSSKVGSSRSFVRFARPGDVDMIIMERDPHGVVARATETCEHHVNVLETGL